MLFGLLAMDLVWALGLVLVAAPSAMAGYSVFVSVAVPGREVDIGFAAALAFATFAVVYVALVCLVLLLVPKPAPGRYPVLRGKNFFLWAIGLIVRRWLDVPPVSTLVRQSAIARSVYLRCAGARIHSTVNMSSDVVLLDPAGLVIAEGSMLGFCTTISGHMVVNGELTVAPVVIGRSVETGGNVAIALGAQIGDRVQLAPFAVVGPFARVEDEARIGTRATIGAHVKVGKRARIAPHTFVPTGTSIPDGGEYPPLR